MHFTLTRCATEDGYRYDVTDNRGRVVGSRVAQRALAGAVVVCTEMSDRATVWSWHCTPDAANSAAQRLHRSRPEMLVSAATA